MIWTAIIAWLVCGVVVHVLNECGALGDAVPRPFAVIMAAARSLDFALAVHGLSRRQRVAKVLPKLVAMGAVVAAICVPLWPLGLLNAWRRARAINRRGGGDA